MSTYISSSTYINAEICNTDGECALVCPVEALVIKTQTLVWDQDGGGTAPVGKDLYFREDTCIDCGICTDACPTGAIYTYHSSGGNSSDGDGGGDGDGDSNIEIEVPEEPIFDLKKFINCLDPKSPAKLALYAEQPVPNTSEAYNILKVGHAFISINQGNQTKVIGFYPNYTSPGPHNPTGPGIYGEDGSMGYNVSYTLNITANQLSDIIAYINKKNLAKYDLNNYNCTDFVIEVGRLSGLDVPDAYGKWPGGAGSNPGALGQYLGSLPNSTKLSTIKGAPKSTKCPE